LSRASSGDGLVALEGGPAVLAAIALPPAPDGFAGIFGLDDPMAGRANAGRRRTCFIEHIGPQEFVVVVSAVGDKGQGSYEGSDRDFVRTETLASRDLAVRRRDHLLREVGEQIQARGDRVIDTETN
jgi:hypothetical protein